MEEFHYRQQQLPTATVATFNPAANAAMSNPLLSSNHPSYSEMITAAILWDASQGKEGGSSKRAIAKYIDRVYSGLPPTHSSLLTHHLTRMKATGQLVMFKNSYQLPIVAAAATTGKDIPIVSPDQDSTPKRRAGRPPKPKSVEPKSIEPKSIEPEFVEPVSVGTNGLSGVKRSRGRPPKDQVVSKVPFVQAEPSLGFGLNENGSPGSPGSSVRRRPGRPKKQTPTQTQTHTQDLIEFQLAVVPVNGIVSSKKRPGRPAKVKLDNGVVGLGPGSVSGGSKPRGRPKRNVLGPVAGPTGKKPRGRSIKQLGVGAGPRRVGRPPKAGVLPLSKAVMRKIYTGKPRGRPKKLAVVPMNGIVSSKKRPGRPPMTKVGNGVGLGPGPASVNGGSKPRGRPKRNVLGPVSSPIGKRPRGRPPRQLGVGVGPIFGKRRVGKPPKVSVVPLSKAVLRKIYTGKPRGRPKKGAAMPGRPKKLKVDEELVKKVQNMQAKIRDAVSMLKSYFPTENATNEALIAFQQLEDISITDITGPPSNPPLNPPVTTLPNNNPVIGSGSSDVEIPPSSVVPFSISDPLLNGSGSDPFYMGPNDGNEQQNSWIPLGDEEI